jgi:hypothetical protein
VKITTNLAKILSQRLRQSGDKYKDLLVLDFLKQDKQEEKKQ